MPDQLDNHSGPEENVDLTYAFAEIFVLCATFSAEIRELVFKGDEADVSPEALIKYSQQVRLSMNEQRRSDQERGEGELSIGVTLKLSFNEESRPLRHGILISRSGEMYQVSPSLSRRVFRDLSQISRDAVAEYMTCDAEMNLSHIFESRQQWNLLQGLPERVQRLREQIETGNLPAPPTSISPVSWESDD